MVTGEVFLDIVAPVDLVVDALILQPIKLNTIQPQITRDKIRLFNIKNRPPKK
jgi:hypothetical protein